MFLLRRSYLATVARYEYCTAAESVLYKISLVKMKTLCVIVPVWVTVVKNDYR
jgi:hypothetical protein